MQAQLDDPEVVEWVLAQPERSGPTRPALEDFTPAIEALYGVIDHLGGVITAVYVAGGKKPPHIKPMPRPVTGIDRAKARRAKQAHLSLVEEVKQAQERYLRAREGG